MASKAIPLGVEVVWTLGLSLEEQLTGLSGHWIGVFHLVEHVVKRRMQSSRR
jgi:hypothetical protein